MAEEYTKQYEMAGLKGENKRVDAQAKNMSLAACTSMVFSACSYGEGLPSREFSSALLVKVEKDLEFYEKELMNLNASKSFRVYSGLKNFARKVKKKIKG